ncbi:MAG TPA: hypothetical protein VMC43_00770 [Candidatus Paceibacterota bacterium]|nr:hypothetical protein [Candidatus Paceibacterota bacterium]
MENITLPRFVAIVLAIDLMIVGVWHIATTRQNDQILTNKALIADYPGVTFSDTPNGPVPTSWPISEHVDVPEVRVPGLPITVAVPDTGETKGFYDAIKNTRAFRVFLDSEQMVPSTFIVNQGDNVRFEVSSFDNTYDLTQPEYDLHAPIKMGLRTILPFKATQAGTYLLYCQICGGPLKGPVGYLMVTPK